MRLMVVDPAADWSTRDVFNGLVHGLTTAGHEVLPFYYGRRIAMLQKALHYNWLAQGKTDAERGQHPLPVEGMRTASELAVTWAMRHEPDWVIVVSSMFFHPDAYIFLRRAGLKTAVMLTESPYDVDKEARHAQLVDLAWTNERSAVSLLRTINPQTFYLRHAFHPENHRPDDPDDLDEFPSHDVVFCGTGFPERIEMLSAIDWTGIDLGLYGMWSHLPGRHRLRQYIKGGVTPNPVTAALYRRAKIGLNFFRQTMGFGKKAPRIVSGIESLGPRNYELAATGCFHLSDYRPEVEETFGTLVPTFRSAEELQRLLQRWLPDHSGRTAIRKLLPVAVSGHSWDERAVQIIADLQQATRRDVAA